MDGVRDLYAARGIILKPVDLTDLFLYVTYDGHEGNGQHWGMKPGGFALAKACTRVLEPDGQQYLQQWWGYQSGRKAEQHYREIFSEDRDFWSPGPTMLLPRSRRARNTSRREIFGEITPTVGRSLNAEYEGYDGIILIGPFNCLPFRISEAILKPLSIQQGMPLAHLRNRRLRCIARRAQASGRAHSAGSRALRQGPFRVTLSFRLPDSKE